MNSPSEFVVAVDQAKITQARAQTLKAMTTSAILEMCGAVVIVGLVTPVLLFSEYFWALLLAIAGIFLLSSSIWKFVSIRRLRRSWEKIGIAAVAMRVNADGLRCSIDAAPESIFLPWECVAGLRLYARRAHEVLVLNLADGVTPNSPGVTGLEHREVQRMLRKKMLGIRGLRYAPSVLDQPVTAISRALFQFSEGKVWVT